MVEIIWYRAANGLEFSLEAGSAAAKLVAADRSIIQIDESELDNEGKPLTGHAPVIVDLGGLSEFERIELAKTILGIPSGLDLTVRRDRPTIATFE